ncbi:MAG: YhbY family RNA-binding protein [Acholeplasmatales bacterium]|nr:YhbY family RNA-binding protein [Acholeplasmatales bacterium]
MLNPKEKAYLKSLAHHIKPSFQIGKDGLNENMLNDVLNYLNKHEIIKISILQNSFVTADEAIEFFEEADIEFVQHIGRTLVLYKHSDNAKNPIVLPVKQ